MSIEFFYRETNYRIRESKKVKKLIIEVIRSENQIPGDLNFIFAGNDLMEELNSRYLKHEYPTDVLGFCYSQGGPIDGDVYIGIEVVRMNSKDYKVSLKNETVRVIIHGTLHLLGYTDANESDRKEMKKIEDNWLKAASEKYGIQV